MDVFSEWSLTIVCGVKDPSIQRRLLAEKQLTFEKVAGIALAMEMAAHNVETLRSGSGDVGELTVDKSSLVHQLQAATNTKAPWPAKSGSCYCCGQTSHGSTMHVQGSKVLLLQ